jgi:predicted DNA-binding antitoxin AbrB/MazE fold protein
MARNDMATVRVIYEDGVFKPQEPVSLPEHAEAHVLLPPAVDAEGDSTGWKALEGLIGLADEMEGPTDVSENHDEYLYGSKRRR